MSPAPGSRLVRFVGDRILFRLSAAGLPEDARGFLRTNLTRAAVARAEVTARGKVRLAGEAPFAGASWRDIPLERTENGFEIDLPLLEIGYFYAKAYAADASGVQHWPEGFDIGISVQPNAARTANLVYCAFPRAFGPDDRTIPPAYESAVKELDRRGFVVIPPSGKLRDLTRTVPHIMDQLGFRVIHLLPIGPVPTTHARMGRYGSPYAQLDLTQIDPALVVHDGRTNAVDQLRELTDAVHARCGMVFLDVVLNHTGWASRLFDTHPEWFVKNPDGSFHSPGAWGTVWADLVELDHSNLELWHELAEALTTWCRRGIDGFRCDAGYMVPLPAWQFVIAEVRAVFPNCIFLLEGLGGSWEATEALLTDGGMQWAYSELFQNYSGEEVARYLDHAIAASERSGLLLHYAETHDNPRLAAKGRAWSLLRNRLCALAAPSGAYAITSGVEWLETEKIDVHEARPLGFGREPNIVPEIARLTRLLSDHPCFFDGATLRRVSEDDATVLALERVSADGKARCLVLVNLDVENPGVAELEKFAFERAAGDKAVDLLGGPRIKARLLPKPAEEAPKSSPPASSKTPEAAKAAAKLKAAALVDRVGIDLEAGGAVCLSTTEVRANSGDAYRRKRAQAAWALTALATVLPHEDIGKAPFEELAAFASADPRAFLGSIGRLDPGAARVDLLDALRQVRRHEGYAEVVTWTIPDKNRVTLLPPGHWLLIWDPRPFEVELDLPTRPRRFRSIEVDAGHVVAIAPLPDATERDFSFKFDEYEEDAPPIVANVRLLAPSGDVASGSHAAERVLLTNGRGAMSRIVVDLGRVMSKYDCILGANLHPEVPTDRHVLVKRLRAWLSADGFVTPLDGESTVRIDPGPPARFEFAAHAGDGRHVRVDIEIDLVPEENTVLVRCSRPQADEMDTLPPECGSKITLRLDLEDRSYHTETHYTAETEAHFTAHTRALPSNDGFEFRPAKERRLLATVDRGTYHPSAEWSRDIFHPEEATRGLNDRGDAFSPGWFDLPLARGESAQLTITAEPDVPPPQTPVSIPPSPLLRSSARPGATESPFIEALQKAARAFIVRRGTGKTIIAGYPWFLDWGRDSLIAARGLLSAGFIEETRSVLRTFARLERNGTLPNFLAGAEDGSRESSDAPLWFALACDEYARVRGDQVLAEPIDDKRSLADVLASICENYAKGTENGTIVDPETGLPWSPPHFTWMDTNYPAGTPREGYPIELGALFARLAALLDRIGMKATGTSFADWYARAKSGLDLFYDPVRGYCGDTLHAPRGTPARAAQRDDHLRPNQLFAVSLGLVPVDRARRIVEQVARFLLVPGALRTLAPRGVEVPLPIVRDGVLLNDPRFPYAGHYEGDEDTRRKPAYHNGTAWPWLLPVYCESMVVAWPDDERAKNAARAVLGSSARALREGTLGQIPEIMDGDAPHRHRGCDAQAWSVTETLRVALRLEEA